MAKLQVSGFTADDLMTCEFDWHELANRYAIRFGGLLVTVTDKHIRYSGKWIMDCPPYFHEKVLQVKTKEQAQAEAVRLVRKQVEVTMGNLAKFEHGQNGP